MKDKGFFRTVEGLLIVRQDSFPKGKWRQAPGSNKVLVAPDVYMQAYETTEKVHTLEEILEVFE